MRCGKTCLNCFVTFEIAGKCHIISKQVDATQRVTLLVKQSHNLNMIIAIFTMISIFDIALLSQYKINPDHILKECYVEGFYVKNSTSE